MSAQDQPGPARRRYVAWPTSIPNQQLISSAEVTEAGTHDVVRVWSRGGLAGELVVGRGDGARLCCLVFLLEPESDHAR